jgi:hypothetical protein
MYQEGGIYFDSDVYVLQSFDEIRNSPRDVVLGHEGGNRFGLCGGVMLARPGSPFIKRWIKSYSTFKKGEWNEHSVVLPKEMTEENPYSEEVCTLSPHAFFWPTWTTGQIEWMHEPLSDELADVEETLKTNDGSLFKGQLAYHGWNSALSGDHLTRLTEQVVLHRDTRFNLMVRRFIRGSQDVGYGSLLHQ